MESNRGARREVNVLGLNLANWELGIRKYFQESLSEILPEIPAQCQNCQNIVQCNVHVQCIHGIKNYLWRTSKILAKSSKTNKGVFFSNWIFHFNQIGPKIKKWEKTPHFNNAIVVASPVRQILSFWPNYWKGNILLASPSTGKQQVASSTDMQDQGWEDSTILLQARSRAECVNINCCIFPFTN
jgi:hypothetical protein